MIALLFAAGCAGPATLRDRSAARQVQRTDQREQIEQLLQGAARRHGVDPALVRGVIQVESSFRVDARSSAGARGLMQLMPATAAGLARQLKWGPYEIADPAFNIEAGTAYLAYLLERFDGSRPLALAAYHTGPARVARWVSRDRPLPSYSRRYVQAVLAASDRLRLAPDTPLEPRELDRSALRELLRARLDAPRERATPEPPSDS